MHAHASLFVLKSNSIMAASLGLSVARTELGPTLLLPFWTATVVANVGKA
jgi:ABC-type Fe3+-siderophore transport system permease subunit